MNLFKKTVKVVSTDLDDLNHVNNVRYVQWIQDISKEHWQEVAPLEIKEGIIWVVRNHNIDYKGSALLGDEILIQTYIKETRGALSVRCVEMYNKRTNVLLIRSLTEWCLLNAKNLRPSRISQDIIDIFLYVEISAIHSSGKKV